MEALRKRYAGRIPVHLANGVAYLWEVCDVECVRKQYRLCGLLSGTLPLITQQNVFLGLPLRLLPEEVTLLVRRNAAVLIDDLRAYLEVDEEERVRFLEKEAAAITHQKERTLKQQEEHRKQVEADLAAKGDDALARRRARQAAKVAAAHQLQVTDAQPPEAHTSAPPSDDTLERLPYVHYTPGTPAATPGYRPLTQAMHEEAPRPGDVVNAYTSLKDACAAGVWTYPTTLQERARCAVFEALHNQGYYLSTGLRFGGDFVAYPGDPLRYHSHFTATVLATPHTQVPAYHIVASGRLGTAVKKSHLLCQAHTHVSDDTVARARRLDGADDAHTDAPAQPWGDVETWSLAWAGFGT